MRKDKLAIYLQYGAKGNGKSLVQAVDALSLFKSYWKTEKKYPELPKRIYFGNQKFSKEIELRELGIHLFYWSSAKQLRWCPRPKCWIKNDLGEQYPHSVHDTDIGHDEIGKDLPAGAWADTPPWFKQVFSHLRKRGNRYFANTQVYEDIDISFRRQIDFAFKLEKLFGSGDITATSPKPKFLWGVITRRAFDPMALEHERDPEKRERMREADPKLTARTEIILIRKKWVNAYNTQDELPPYKPDTLEHVAMYCEDENCEKHGKNNPLAKPKIEHYRI